MTIATRKILVLSTMRDEGPYILEWLAYHKAIGLNDFLIYTNDCRDGTDLLLDRLQQNGELIHIRTNVLKRGPQKSAYKEAMEHPVYRKADWVLVSDADEFLNIHVGAGHVQDLLDRFPKAEVIPICWRHFSHNSHERLLDGFLLTALTDAESANAKPKAVGRFVKSMFKPSSQITRIGCHTPIYAENYQGKVTWGAKWLEVNPSEKPHRPTVEFGYDVVQMNHYAVRTLDTFLLKLDRGDAIYTKKRLELEYWQRWCLGGNEDVTIHKHLPATRAEFDRLMSDPVVAALHTASSKVHAQRLDIILGNSDVKKLKYEILEAEGMTSDAPKPAVVNIHAANLASKAPGRHKNRLKMLEQMPKGGRCAEIGVWNGGFSECILDVTKPSELTLIDPWELLAEKNAEEWTHTRHKDHKFMRKMYDHVTSCYSSLPNVSIRKGFSAEVLEDFPDNYFDWIYIDGNHQYEFVRQDMEIAFKKVRPGGTIAGDDFFWKRNNRMHVKEAVIDVMRANGMQNRPTRFGQQFMITLPHNHNL